MDVSRGIAEVLATGGDRPAIEFQGRWHSWAELRAIADGVIARLDEAGVPPDVPVALVVRNRVPHAAAILGLIGAGRTVSMVYSMQSAEAIGKDLASLRAAAVVADRDDWTGPAEAGAREAGSAGISIALEAPVSTVAGLERMGPGPHRQPPATRGLELLTSGTTGAPKRIHLPMAALTRGIVTATLGEAVQADMPPFVMFLPLGNIAVVMLIAQAFLKQRVILMEKFQLEALLAVVKAYRLQTMVAVVPVIRQMLDADIPKSDLASVKFLFGGAGPLDPELQEAFEAKYGIPILWGYGATEFAGTAATWTPDLREQFGAAKRGSVGRATAGVQLRIVDAATGAVLPPGGEGFLEARVEILGERWIRTTDLASIDADGFVFIRARGDGAINRGGFKIIPERVAEVLRRHPAVKDAVVVGIKDAKLGEVPAALVEVRSDVTSGELEALVRGNLPAHHVPARFRFVREMPRTPSMKVRLDQARRLLEEGTGA